MSLPQVAHRLCRIAEVEASVDHRAEASELHHLHKLVQASVSTFATKNFTLWPLPIDWSLVPTMCLSGSGKEADIWHP